MIAPQQAEQLLPALVEQPQDAHQPQPFVAAPLARQLLVRAGDRQPPQPRGLRGCDARQLPVHGGGQHAGVVELAEHVLQPLQRR